MNFDTIRYEQAGPIATLTLNRPERRNAVNGTMVRELNRALTKVSASPELRVLVLTGAGNSFSPGADFQTPPPGRGLEADRTPEDFRLTVLLHEMPAITIAAINGACAGAALGWACACDLRYCAGSARFNTAWLDVGVAGDMGAIWTLPRIVGAARARELCFCPGKFDAAEALRIGLVSRVFPDREFAGQVAAVANRLAEMSPAALRGMKANFVAAEKMSLRDYVDFETERHLDLLDSPDTHEAFAAKAEGRKAKFTG